MDIKKDFFGLTKNGSEVYKFTLSNNCISVEIINFGATVTAIKAPDKNNVIGDIALGYDDVKSYEDQDCFFGATIGRYANRIKDGKFVINNEEYSLGQNDGDNHLHGGFEGYDKKLWDYELEENCLKLSYISPHMEENYPGQLRINVSYTLTENNELVIDYEAISDKDTVVNLTNHSYFNLKGHNRGDILDHYLKISAEEYTQKSSDNMPTGKVLSVKDTPFDFSDFKKIGDDINSDLDEIRSSFGYDSNFIVNKNIGALAKVSTLKEYETGRCIDVYTTKPGMQLYTGNFIRENTKGKDNAIYGKYSGLCLETQYYPDSINIRDFPSPIIKANEVYNHRTVYRFYIEK